jgi:hypothetical protein
MAYQVNKFNGQFITSVQDGTIDTSTDLRFVGKNYAGYGEIQNENFLHLMENFANTTPPPKPVLGQIWYDSASKKIKFWDGSKFKIAAGAEVSSVQPTGLSAGEFWFDSAAKQLYAYTGTEFVLVGPDTSPDLGASAAVSLTIKDTLGNNHTVVQIIANNVTVAVVSNEEFTVDPTSATPEFYTGFPQLKKGMNVRKTETTGISSAADTFEFWGTASSAKGLVDYTANPPVFKSASEVFGLVSGDFSDIVAGFGNDGLSVGSPTPRLQFRVEENTTTLIESLTPDDTITVRVRSSTLPTERDVAIFNKDGVIPGLGTYNLGSITERWDYVYANNFNGTLRANNGTVAYSPSTREFTGVSFQGNIRNTAGSTVFNSSTNTFGVEEGTTIFRGIHQGVFSGGLAGTADNANSLGGVFPSQTLPIPSDKTSIPVRDASGDIVARKFVGIADNADRLKVGSSYVIAVSALPTDVDRTSILARDANGDTEARLFKGTATAARYADLAEKYLADQEYEVGTVVSVGGEKEVTACQWGDRAIGVVSANPAYMMNSELEGGTYIALKGRVPVKVIGAVKKGQRLIAGQNGTAVPGVPHSSDVFAIALETNTDIGVKFVEALVL